MTEKPLMAEPLKPCPFCGGAARLTNREMPGCAFVVCSACHAQSDDGSIERVVAAWNRRAPGYDAECARRLLNRLAREIAEAVQAGQHVTAENMATEGAYTFLSRIEKEDTA